jgi:DNA-binding NtrC family response regulator
MQLMTPSGSVTVMPLTILVVDDDRAARAGLLELLESAGFAVAGAGSFEEATKALATMTPDLLVADVRLAAFNGLHLLHRSRSTHPRMASIVISGYPDPGIEHEAKQAGAAAFLLKPLDPPAFLAKVNEVLAGCP